MLLETRSPRCATPAGSSSRTARRARRLDRARREPLERRARAGSCRRAESSRRRPPGPGQFAWADPNVIIETMETAGFVEPEVEAVDFTINYATSTTGGSRRPRCRPAPATPTGRWTSPRAATSSPTWSGRRAVPPARRQARDPRPHMGGDARPPKIARHVLRRRRRPGPAPGQDGRHHRLRLPGPRPLPQPQGLGRGRRRRPARGLRSRSSRPRPPGSRSSCRRGRRARRHRHGAGPRRAAPRRLGGAIADGIEQGNLVLFGHGFSDPLRRGQRPAGRRRRARRPQGPGPHRPPPVPRGLRRARAWSRSTRTPPATRCSSRWPTPRASAARAAASSRPPSGTRPRPTCSASRPCSAAACPSWCAPASRRSSRPATTRAGVLRVPARAQADRRPDVREGHQRDALLDLQHGRVRRLHARQADRHRRDPRGHEADPRRDPVRRRSRASGSRRTTPARSTSSDARRGRKVARSSRPGSELRSMMDWIETEF